MNQFNSIQFKTKENKELCKGKSQTFYNQTSCKNNRPIDIHMFKGTRL